MSRTEIIKCDKCNLTIEDGQYHVAAGVYGIDLHSTCLINMTSFEVLKILALDDIKFGTRNAKKRDDYSDYEKLVYSQRAANILDRKTV